MQAGSSRIQTWVAVFISRKENCYTMSVDKIYVKTIQVVCVCIYIYIYIYIYIIFFFFFFFFLVIVQEFPTIVAHYQHSLRHLNTENPFSV